MGDVCGWRCQDAWQSCCKSEASIPPPPLLPYLRDTVSAVARFSSAVDFSFSEAWGRAPLGVTVGGEGRLTQEDRTVRLVNGQ